MPLSLAVDDDHISSPLFVGAPRQSSKFNETSPLRRDCDIVDRHGTAAAAVVVTIATARHKLSVQTRNTRYVDISKNKI